MALLSACGEDNKTSSLSSTPTSGVATIPPTPTPTPQMVKVAVIKGAEGGLNVREAANTDSDVIDVAENGDKFLLLVAEAKDGWYNIQFGARNAFISAEYVEVQEISKAEADSLTSKPDSSETENSPTPSPSSGSEPASSNSDVSSKPYNPGDEDGES